MMATGHSFTSIIETDGLLLDLEKIKVIKAVYSDLAKDVNGDKRHS